MSAAQYPPSQEGRPANFPPGATPAGEFGVNPSAARPAHLPPEYIARQQYASQQPTHAHTGSMAQATSPSMSLQDGHQNNHHTTPHIKSNPDVPIDPSIAAASSPTYPPYSPYAPQNHDMSQYQGHPPQGYPHWPQQYAGHPHGMPNGPYSSPGTAVSAAGSAATAGPRGSQVGPHRRDRVPRPPASTVAFLRSADTIRVNIRCPKCTPLFPSPARNSTSARVVDMRKSNGCTSVDGKDARRRTAR